MSPDEREYESIAQAIMNGKSTTDFYFQEYNINHNDIGLLVTPLYPAFIALVYKCFGANPLYVYLLQLIMNQIILILLFILVKKYTNGLFACISTSLVAGYFPLWNYNFNLLMEVPSIFLMMLTIFVIERYISSSSVKLFVILSTLWGSLIFLNNRFVVHYFLVTLFLVLNTQFSLNNALKRISISFFIVFLCFLPWHIRQYIVYDEIIIFAPLRAPSILNKDYVRRNLTIGLKEPVEFPNYKGFLNQAAAYDSLKDEEKRKVESLYTTELYLKLKKNWEGQDPLWFYRFLENFRVYRFKEPSFEKGTQIVRFRGYWGLKINILNTFSLLPALLLMPLGIYFSIRNKQIFFQIISVFIVSNWIVNTAFQIVVERYTYLVIPLVFMLSTYGLYAFSRSSKKTLLVLERKGRNLD